MARDVIIRGGGGDGGSGDGGSGGVRLQLAPCMTHHPTRAALRFVTRVRKTKHRGVGRFSTLNPNPTLVEGDGAGSLRNGVWNRLRKSVLGESNVDAGARESPGCWDARLPGHGNCFRAPLRVPAATAADES